MFYEQMERFVGDYGAFQRARGEVPVRCERAATVDEVLRRADVVSPHPSLDDSCRHLIDASCLGLMKPDALLVRQRLDWSIPKTNH